MTLAFRFPHHALRAGLAVSLLVVSGASLAREARVRYLGFEEAQETLRMFADSGIPGSEIRDPAAWNAWIREQDKQVRARIDRGVEDSISNLILHGTSYTNLPRVESAEIPGTQPGEVSADAQSRAHALAALEETPRGERVRFVREYLARKGIAKE